MGEPTALKVQYPDAEYIGCRKQTQGSEPSQYLKEEKTISDFVSSGERTRNSPNRWVFGCHRGCRTCPV